MVTNELKIISSLIKFDQDRLPLHKQLANLPWDYTGQPELLTLTIFNSVLSRWKIGELKDEDILWWSNAIECRDHIDYEADHTDLLSECIFSLASPEINHVGPYAGLVEKVISNCMRK